MNNKRLSKSEQKKQQQKKKLKNQNKLKQATVAKAPKKILSKQTKVILPFMLVSLMLFNFLKPPVVVAEPTKTIYEHASLEEIDSAREELIKELLVNSPGYKAEQDKIKMTEALSRQILKIVQGTPMEAMVSEIAKKDRAVAAYIVGIAMKESKFGVYSPKKNGNDCFNYWGYRGKENTTASGYSCFDSPGHAVSVVGNKIASMLGKGARSPASMISWKCGSSCAGHDPDSVTKWIADVAINYYKLNPSKEVAKSD